jgi:DNA-binding MarR family transcriptional regulator
MGSIGCGKLARGTLGPPPRRAQNLSDEVDQAISRSLGLNRTDARCISYLMTRGAMTAGELAAIAGVAPTALTFAIDRLEQAGYLQRERDPADGRRVLVKAAAAARRLADSVWSETITESEACLSKYTRPQLTLLIRFVRDQVELQRRHSGRIREKFRARGAGGRRSTKNA